MTTPTRSWGWEAAGEARKKPDPKQRPRPAQPPPGPAVRPADPRPGPRDPAHPAPAGSGAPRAQPGQLLGGRPWPLRVHSRWRAAGPGPLGTILPAAPGAVSGSAGPMRGPEASPAHAAASRVSQGPAAEVSW